ncbi:putative E3 ubiquitin-protein ligase [Nymphaea thermarum]|nr:putative E3 ubiquitin-protein ligase [Nymphaea thermarum]
MDDDIYGNALTKQGIDTALIALKKGTQLVKYSRKGKPKVCPFRLSTDEATLIWYSRGEERNLKLSSVSKIIPGQRTAVFRRYLRPEKDYLSFSLIYNNGERSLDLICKDKVESEVWFAGLKALISTGQRKRSKFEESSERSSSYNGEFVPSTPPLIHSPLAAALEINSLNTSNTNAKALANFALREPSLSLVRSDVGSDYANMQLRGTGDGFRLSISSLPSTSSQSSGPDDCESLGDVYVWGEVWFDGTATEGTLNSLVTRTDVLLPKPLESNVVLDVHQISCGVRHAALITKQGEVFTWGEESGGRLGHGVDADVCRPQLVESLAVSNAEHIACGEHHTCAVTVAGDLYTWGDGTHNAGLLGHGTDVSHWIPKRVSGPLEGLQVSSVACGTWHSAVATSNGQLFTFGDGTFGVLGHGTRESTAYPKEVESLRGLKTIKVACGVWHTAAIVEVIVTQHGAHVSSRKLFTWGDGDKYRLGHGDKEARLVPTCVSSLIDYNFHSLACGHSITVGLTTSGHIFTMGSVAHGQLGNPQSDGKVPCLVQDRLVGEYIEEIACGSHHVVVLTSRSEVYTWGKGANGRLGHGDVEDRKTPCLVEALKDRHVRNISCGSNFTAVVCLHKWVSGADQSVCSGCRQAFGFTRKRHNCYNCGLVHCHACSSKKALKAALAPTPGKPHRVCDLCFAKLKAAENSESSITSKRNLTPRRMGEPNKMDRSEMKSSRILQPLIVAQVKQFEPSSNSRPVSPFSRRPSPPRSTSPAPTMGGLAFSKNMVDTMKKTNELLNQEVQKLQAQVKSLKRRCEAQEMELQKSEKKAQDAESKAEEEIAKRNVARDVIKSLTTQLNEVVQKLPPEFPVDDMQNLIHHLSAIANSPSDICQSSSLTVLQVEDMQRNEGQVSTYSFAHDSSDPERTSFDNPSLIRDMADTHDRRSIDSTEGTRLTDMVSHDSDDERVQTNRLVYGGALEAKSNQNFENGLSAVPSTPRKNDEVEAQWIEQFESGVYVTLLRLRDGTKVLKKVKFSRKKFVERQAEVWWAENHGRVFEKYNVRGIMEKPPAPSTSAASQIPALTFPSLAALVPPPPLPPLSPPPPLLLPETSLAVCRRLVCAVAAVLFQTVKPVEICRLTLPLPSASSRSIASIVRCFAIGIAYT